MEPGIELPNTREPIADSLPTDDGAVDLPSRRTCACGARLGVKNASGVCTVCREVESAYVPTPDEIRAACAQIRSEWDATRWSQARPASRWSVPRVRISQFDLDG